MRSSRTTGVTASIEPLVAALLSRLDSDLEAVLRLENFAVLEGSSPAAAAHLFVIVSADVSPLEIRNALHPLWTDVAKPGPLGLFVATKSELTRHLQLEPYLASALTRHSKLLFGQYHFPTASETSDELDLARQAHASLHYSALLAPSLLPTHEIKRLQQGLSALHRSVVSRPVDGEGGVANMVSQIQQHLGPRIRLRETAAFERGRTRQQPPLIPGLVAVYERQQALILVLQDDEPGEFINRILATNWEDLIGRGAGQYRALQLTTPEQLRLVAALDAAADFFLGYFSHVWGSDVLAGLEVQNGRVLQCLGRWPSQLALADVAQLVVSSAEDEFFMVVHDLQNKLLNVQLRNELYGRRLGQAPQSPPITLPEPSAPIERRLEAILAHLHGWADHYWELMGADSDSLGR